MKKLLTFALSLCMVLGLSITAFAADFKGEAESELKDITDEIITTVNEVYMDKIGTEITVDDIDFSKAFKIYVDTDVFALPTNNINDVTNTLKSGNYIYLLPITTSKGTVVVNIQKGLPLSDNAKSVLTEREQQEILSKVGNWVVSGISFYDLGNTSYNYENSLLNEIGEIPEGTVFVGSLPVFHDVVALVPNNTGEIESLVAVAQTPYDVSGYSVARDNSKIFDYEQIKEYVVNEAPKENPEMNAGTGSIPASDNNTLVLIVGVMMSILTMAVLIVVMKKNKSAK